MCEFEINDIVNTLYVRQLKSIYTSAKDFFYIFANSLKPSI
jgi:hypothetical protein